MRGALQGRRPRLHLFALLQSQYLDVREPHVRARRRGSCARYRHGHGCGNDRDPRAAAFRRPRGGGESDVRLLPLRDRRPAAALRHHLDAGRRPRSRPVAKGDAAEHAHLLPRKPDQSDARRARHFRHRGNRAQGRRAAHRRQRVRDADLAEPARTRRRRRGVFGDQAHRRSGPLPRRHHPVVERFHPGAHPQLHAPDRPIDFAVQCVDAGEGAGNAGDPRAPADPKRCGDRRRAGAAPEDFAADLSGPRRSSAGGTGEEADARGLHPDRFRSEGRQAGGIPLPQRTEAVAHQQ